MSKKKKKKSNLDSELGSKLNKRAPIYVHVTLIWYVIEMRTISVRS
jgi:hypothetical protein